MALKLKRQGLLSRFYKFTFCKDAPDSLCTFFWGLVIGLLVLPITWLSVFFFMILRKFDDHTEPDNLSHRLLFGFMMYLGVAIVLLYLGALINNTTTTILWTVGCVLAFWVLSLVGKNTGEHELTRVIKEFIKSRKEKYCPKIDWDDKEE